MSIYGKLIKIQNELKAPKSQYNSFGKYSYRSCEDIMEALKPLLQENNCVIFVSDSVNQVGDRYYIEAKVTFVDCETGESVINTALAREEENKKGADSSQITGSASSYARKYALNGMFCIDDTKDADATNTRGKDKDKTKNAGNNKGTSASEEISNAQINRLAAIAKSANIPIVKVKQGMIKDYGVNEFKKLSKAQYDALCDRLEKAKEKTENKN